MAWYGVHDAILWVKRDLARSHRPKYPPYDTAHRMLLVPTEKSLGISPILIMEDIFDASFLERTVAWLCDPLSSIVECVWGVGACMGLVQLGHAAQWGWRGFKQLDKSEAKITFFLFKKALREPLVSATRCSRSTCSSTSPLYSNPGAHSSCECQRE